MKQNKLTLIVAGVLAVIFVLLLFIFQVRTTEVAVVTTFGKPGDATIEPGAHFKWPWPVQKVYRFDHRVQSFEDKFEQTLTRDNFTLLVQAYVGWRISDPALFLKRFNNGSVEDAERALEGLVRSAKNAVVGQFNFSDFISTDSSKLKLADVEAKLLQTVRASQEQYGITVEFLGVRRLGLPESITEKVIARMEAERRTVVQRLEGEGERSATTIRSRAERESDEIRARAEAEALRIRGEGEAEAAKHYQVLAENRELAEYLLKLKALEQSLQQKSTLILDQNTAPFDLLSAPAKN